MSITPKVAAHIAELAAKEKMGARPIKRIIQKLIENQLSTLLLSKQLPENSTIKFSLIKGELKYKITEEEV
jgi:ATP-dependent Clp protease ATP-binding subunit ClpB